MPWCVPRPNALARLMQAGALPFRASRNPDAKHIRLAVNADAACLWPDGGDDEMVTLRSTHHKHNEARYTSTHYRVQVLAGNRVGTVHGGPRYKATVQMLDGHERLLSEITYYHFDN